MGKFDDLARRLRARVEQSASREKSLDWKAAGAIDELRAKIEALQAENTRLDAENRTLRTENERGKASAVEVAPTVEREASLPPGMRALSVKEAAALLSVSYRTAFEHKASLGFFRVGAAWRVWPEDLKAATSGSVAKQAKSEEPQPSQLRTGAGVSQMLGLSRSAREAAAELDELLARRTERRSKTKGGA
ncbi:MAG: hypothetical protein EPN70_00730 [Paraburkholderia sp.]|uniref:hypothetical protein n=1 Tax=Paraburkholderia sp. TaxID=1926495 RepID=UPI0012261CB5|nr:hypothetical protein [Paraburkholderia sp.]TAM08299.1 MAG: hypothetical protein EPN70_00730 [Paraburkholderia sp.]TAM28047.1 MAG: hypothetical protein EPN59_17915 [Paraburkholderia sp.]